jgi:hypothetical protein
MNGIKLQYNRLHDLRKNLNEFMRFENPARLNGRAAVRGLCNQMRGRRVFRFPLAGAAGGGSDVGRGGLILRDRC